VVSNGTLVPWTSATDLSTGMSKFLLEPRILLHQLKFMNPKKHLKFKPNI